MERLPESPPLLKRCSLSRDQGITEEVNPELFHKFAPKTCNIKVKITYHLRSIIDFRPKLSCYEEELVLPQTSTLAVHLTPKELVTRRSTRSAIYRIMCRRLKLHLNKEDFKRITGAVQSAKSHWKDGDPVIIVAGVDFFYTLVTPVSIPVDVLVPVELEDPCCGTSTCCSVCLEEFVQGKQVFKTLCSHLFHENCIGMWLSKKENCPMCRSHLVSHHFTSD